MLQARILEWVTIPFSRESFRPRDQTQLYHTAGELFNLLSHQGSPGALGWPPKMERRRGWGHSPEGSQGCLEGNWQIQIPLHHCHPNVCDLQSLQERKMEGTKDMSRTTDVAWLGPRSPAGVSALTCPLLSHLKGRAVEQGPDPHCPPLTDPETAFLPQVTFLHA